MIELFNGIHNNNNTPCAKDNSLIAFDFFSAAAGSPRTFREPMYPTTKTSVKMTRQKDAAVVVAVD